jgi:hypothetical protein
MLTQQLREMEYKYAAVFLQYGNSKNLVVCYINIRANCILYRGAVLSVYENEPVFIENKYSKLLAGSVPDIRTTMPLSLPRWLAVLVGRPEFSIRVVADLTTRQATSS